MTNTSLSRRHILMGIGAAACIPARVNAFATPTLSHMPDALMKRALQAVAQNHDRLTTLDRIGIVDFSQPSRSPRFYIVDMLGGVTRSLLVAHGRGSDPEHTGWLEKFSNLPGSNASSAGAYVTGTIYEGKHGTSRRLIGLEDRNSNAESRAIVIHSASYVGADVVAMQGKLGRSEGCLTVAPKDITYVLDALGEGRLIYADRL